MNAVHREDRSRDGMSATPLDEKPGGRKKRSMKLEVSFLSISLLPVL